MKSDNDTLAAIGAGFIAILLGAPLIFGAMVYGAFANGYVISSIWNWYLLPFGLPVMSWKVASMGGIALRMGLANQRDVVEDHDDEPLSKRITRIIAGIVWPWLILGLAWWLK